MTLAAAALPLGYLPSPTQGVWHVGPFPIRAYAMCILLGIVFAVWFTERRLRERGARPGLAYDVSVWAVPFGIVGGRIYHVITTPEPYWGSGGHPLRSLYIWEGGLGIWGAIALGGVGAWIGCRRHGVSWPAFADAAAPGILIAQGIGRWGNWFNNELYGRATDQPWGLTIHEWHLSTGRAVTENGSAVVLGHFQPTFLYESLWAFAGAGVLLWADRRFTLGHGRVFALYVIVYTVGRAWIEALRVDEAEHILGLRLNLWTCLVAFIGGVVSFVISARLHPGREDLSLDRDEEVGSYRES